MAANHHLLPFFAKHRLTQITVGEVDRYRQAKVAERQLSAESINNTLIRLGQILDLADEYDLIQRNPLRVNPKNRKLKVGRPPAVWLDRADQIEALLDAAGERDRRARPDQQHVPRRAMLAVLVFGGLRLEEMLALRWRHVDLAAPRLYVADAKSEAGVRHVDLLPALQEALATYKAGYAHLGPYDLVFPTRTGRKFSRDNVRNRVFGKALELPNERRIAVDLPPLPEGLTPHTLRHTCCSLLIACGYELPRVKKMLGHADTDVTVRIYAHVMAPTRPSANGCGRSWTASDWAPMGTSTPAEPL